MTEYFLCWLVIGILTAAPFWYFLSCIVTELRGLRATLEKHNAGQS